MRTDDWDLSIDPELDRRLRRSLAAVAETVTDEPLAAVTPQTSTALTSVTPALALRRAKRKKRRRLTVGLALAALPLAAFGYALGAEHVDQIPPKNAFISGQEDGDHYWVVPSFHRDVCDRPFDGVELVMESNNKVGEEWNTAGTAYGDQKPVGGARSGCFEVDESAWLRDPSRTAMLRQRLGDDEKGPWIMVLAVHPSVTAVRVTGSAVPARILPTKAMPSRPDGPRYIVFTIPARASVAIEWTLLTATGQPIAGGTQRMTLNR